MTQFSKKSAGKMLSKQWRLNSAHCSVMIVTNVVVLWLAFIQIKTWRDVLPPKRLTEAWEAGMEAEWCLEC